jgi:heme exporter protein C
MMETTTTRSAYAATQPPGAAGEGDSLAGTRRWALALSALAGATLLVGLWMVFFYVPTEAEMGVVQRIFYLHVPAAWTAFMAFGVVALCSAGYLWLRDPRLDAIAVAAAELGLVFTTLVLLTGPLWAKLAWGAWWVWEPRLTLTLLLWFIYVGYFMVRGAAENPERGKRFGAVLGVVGAVDIPLIHMSVQWWRSQHPQPVVLRPEGAQADPAILQTLFVWLFAFTLLFFALLLFRYGLERLSQRVHALRVIRELRPSPLP